MQAVFSRIFGVPKPAWQTTDFSLPKARAKPSGKPKRELSTPPQLLALNQPIWPRSKRFGTTVNGLAASERLASFVDRFRWFFQRDDDDRRYFNTFARIFLTNWGISKPDFAASDFNLSYCATSSPCHTKSIRRICRIAT